MRRRHTASFWNRPVPRLKALALLGRRLEHWFRGDFIYLLALAGLIGFIVGWVAIGFRELVVLVSRILFSGSTVSYQLAQLHWLQRFLGPIVGGILVGPILYRFSADARGPGISEVMNYSANKGGRIPPRMLLVKTITSALSIGSGSSVGREGPIAYVGASVGSTLAQFLGLDSQRIKILLACGASAGIAATFNAPIAGVVFSIEIILGIGTIQAFSPLVLASVVATSVTRYSEVHYLSGISPALSVPAHQIASAWELFFYVLMGLLIGLGAVLFTRSLYWMTGLWDRVPLPRWMTPMLGACLVGAIGIFIPQVFGNGYDTVESASRGQILWWMLGLLFLLKLLATIVSMGSGSAGGIFAPSLFLGATLGGAFGAIIHAAFPTITAHSGAYAMIGMGAMVAGTTHASLTAIMILFEMTDGYSVILPLMLSSIVALVVSSRISSASIYTLKLLRRRDFIQRGREVDILHQTLVSSILRSKVLVVSPKEHFKELLGQLLGHHSHHSYVVDEETGRFKGVVTLDDVKSVVGEQELLSGVTLAMDIMRTGVPRASPHMSLADCTDLFTHVELDELPVVDQDDTLLGCVTHGDITALFNREVLRFGLLGLRYVTREEAEEGTTTFGEDLLVPMGQRIEAIPIGPEWAGQTLAKLDLRARFGVNIVGVRPAAGAKEIRIALDPNRELIEGEVLLAVGSEDAFKLMKELREKYRY